VHGLAHITGGGISENLPRILPAGLGASIDVSSWRRAPIFDWLQERGNVASEEMLRTFNCGIGMIACVAPDDLPVALEVLRNAGEDAWPIGEVHARGNGVEYRGTFNGFEGAPPRDPLHRPLSEFE